MWCFFSPGLLPHLDIAAWIHPWRWFWEFLQQERAKKGIDCLEWFALRCACRIYTHLLLIFPFLLKVPDRSSCFGLCTCSVLGTRWRRAEELILIDMLGGKKMDFYIPRHRYIWFSSIYVCHTPGRYAWWQNDWYLWRWMLSWEWLKNVLIALGPSFQVEWPTEILVLVFVGHVEMELAPKPAFSAWFFGCVEGW